MVCEEGSRGKLAEPGGAGLRGGVLGGVGQAERGGEGQHDALGGGRSRRQPAAPPAGGPGPPAARPWPRAPPSRFNGWTGVGFAQPNPNDPPEPMKLIASRTPPTGSKWTTGLSVSRPNILAVASPRRNAASAWLNSWTGKAINSMITTT